jgi:hypothetical protein
MWNWPVPKGFLAKDAASNADGSYLIVYLHSLIPTATLDGDQQKSDDEVAIVPRIGQPYIAKQALPEFSLDGQHVAVASLKSVQVFGPNPWTAQIDSSLVNDETSVSRVAVNADGTKALVWVGNTILYVGKSLSKPKKVPARVGISDAVFGPGRRITLLANTHIDVWDPDTSGRDAVQEFACKAPRVVRSADENQVVLYSRSWLHYLTSDGKTLKVTSVFQELPLAPPDLGQQGGGLQPASSPLEIQPMDTEFKVPDVKNGWNSKGNWSFSEWLASMRLQPCNNEPTGSTVHNWRQEMCTVAKQLGREVAQRQGTE